ncbi:hypothetical protein H4582DRAFT_2016233, partial [Lactarius indigo]
MRRTARAVIFTWFGTRITKLWEEMSAITGRSGTKPMMFSIVNPPSPGTPNGLSFFLYLFRYFLFAITVISDAIICSAAAWNLPIAKNANLHTQQQVDIYMIFLGALSLLLVIPMVFIDIFSHRAITGRVWVECLWIDFLWLLHLIGVIFVTAFLPHDMCTPQAKFIDGDSCTSAKLILAFSWICTINLFTYLVALVVSAVLHYKQDYTVWSSHVRSYPWYSHSLAHKLGNRPSSQPPRHQHQAPISAPQPRRPIQLPARAVLSFVHKVEQMHVPDQDPGDPAPDRRPCGVPPLPARPREGVETARPFPLSPRTPRCLFGLHPFPPPHCRPTVARHH